MVRLIALVTLGADPSRALATVTAAIDWAGIAGLITAVTGLVAAVGGPIALRRSRAGSENGRLAAGDRRERDEALEAALAQLELNRTLIQACPVPRCPVRQTIGAEAA